MCGWVQSLIDTFPDARIVVLMRNPGECIPSVLKLVEVSWKGKGWRTEDYALSQQILTEVSFESFTHPAQVLAENLNTPRAVIDYRELTTQPRATIRKAYADLGMVLDPAFDAYLEQQEAREKAHRTHFKYSADEFDLSHEMIEERLAQFYDRYGWPRLSETAAEGEGQGA
jgi:hypothetical protein